MALRIQVSQCFTAPGLSAHVSRQLMRLFSACRHPPQLQPARLLPAGQWCALQHAPARWM